MSVIVFNEDKSINKEVNIIELKGPVNEVNLYYLYVSNKNADEIFSWMIRFDIKEVEFDIKGAQYYSSSISHDLRHEDGNEFKKIKLSKVSF
jgi:hypothetical protein